VRCQQPAFHPNSEFEIPDIHPGIFPVIRRGSNQTIFTLTNITDHPITIDLQAHGINGNPKNLLTGESIDSNRLQLNAYDVVWLDVH
jgi:hypothetical protein